MKRAPSKIRSNHDMREIRCKKCNRLLMKGEIIKVEIKCPKCGYIQILRGVNILGEEVSEAQEDLLMARTKSVNHR